MPRPKRADYDTPDYPYKSQRARLSRLLAEGKCLRCGGISTRPGRRMCTVCAQRHSTTVLTRRARLIARTLCATCGKREAKPGKRWCTECCEKAQMRKRIDRARAAVDNPKPWSGPRLTPVERFRTRARDRRASGLCQQCAKPRGDDGTTAYCRPCARQHTQVVLNRYRRLRDAGQCVRCKAPRGDDGTATECRACADKTLARYHARR